MEQVQAVGEDYKTRILRNGYSLRSYYHRWSVECVWMRQYDKAKEMCIRDSNRSRFGIFRLLVFNELVYLGYLPEYSFRGFIYLLKPIPFFLEFGKIFLCIIRAD